MTYVFLLNPSNKIYEYIIGGNFKIKIITSGRMLVTRSATIDMATKWRLNTGKKVPNLHLDYFYETSPKSQLQSRYTLRKRLGGEEV
jgi:hypothetical protein